MQYLEINKIFFLKPKNEHISWILLKHEPIRERELVPGVEPMKCCSYISVTGCSFLINVLQQQLQRSLAAATASSTLWDSSYEDRGKQPGPEPDPGSLWEAQPSNTKQFPLWLFTLTAL